MRRSSGRRTSNSPSTTRGPRARSSSPPPGTPGSGRSTIRHDCRTSCALRPSMHRGVVNVWNAINALSQPFISVNSFPRSVSTSSTFGVTWSILGPTGLAVTDTHVIWGTVSGRLGNATGAQSGQTHQSYTANGFSMPSGAGALYFKVVATVNGSAFSSPEYGITASSLPDFLFVLYQLLASNLLV